MKKWKRIYELFKQHPRLNDLDRQHIQMCEQLLSLNQPHVNRLVYSELWQQGHIMTTGYRMFVEDLVTGGGKCNIEIV